MSGIFTFRNKSGNQWFGSYKNIQTSTSGESLPDYPLSQPAAGTTGQIKAWNGSAFVAKPVKVWNGSSWAIKPLKYWNGSSWITTPY